MIETYLHRWALARLVTWGVARMRTLSLEQNLALGHARGEIQGKQWSMESNRRNAPMRAALFAEMLGAETEAWP